jgi:hypothetical protein
VGLRYTTNDFSRDSRCAGRHSNQAPLEFKRRKLIYAAPFDVALSFGVSRTAIQKNNNNKTVYWDRMKKNTLPRKEERNARVTLRYKWLQQKAGSPRNTRERNPRGYKWFSLSTTDVTFGVVHENAFVHSLLLVRDSNVYTIVLTEEIKKERVMWKV